MRTDPSVPAAFGRGAVVAAGQRPPPAWSRAARVGIGEAELARPEEAVARLHARWLRREPVVVALAVDPARFREAQVVEAPPHALAPDLDLPHDRLHHLVWANNYDARTGEALWWWGVKASGLGAEPGGGADVVLADGREAWVDGGPRWSSPAAGAPVVHAESVAAGSLAEIPPDPPPPAAQLAPDQLAAVAHPGGPLRVIAPAGSGKTRVLTERMRHLLGERGFPREATIAVAYNRLAQNELESRLADLAPRTRTLNSLGLSLVNRQRRTRVRVLAEPDARRAVEEVFPIPRRRLANTDPVAPYIDALTVVRLGLTDPGAVEEMRDDVPGLAAGFEPYRERLRATGAVDFDEQIYGAVEALLRDGAFRRRVQGEHRHMLVDEFQDLTPAHVLMIRLLAMPGYDVFGVGDDDQTIYDHAGADPRFLVDYGRFFPGAAEAALEVNYRCAESIVEGARNLLAYNRVRVHKEIRAAEDADRAPEDLSIRTHPSAEAATALVELVRKWLGEPDSGPAEVAVLARVNSLLLAPQVALWAAGVPVASAVRPEILERTGTAAALAWLRVALDPEGLLPSDLELIRRRPSRGFPRWISKWLGNCRSLEDLRVVGRRIDDARVAGRIDEMADDVSMLAGLAGSGATTRELLVAVRDRIGLGGAMAMLDGSKGGEAAASHLDDLEGLIQVADLHDDPAGFEPWLRASLAASAGGEGVRLATVHRVKGREWDRVAVFGANTGLLPHRLSESWEAERRVMHVAITRARRRCAVLADAERPSPFLAELRGEAEVAAAKPTVTAGVLGRATARSRAKLERGAAAPEASAAAAALREWRKARADADAVPAYVVLSNRQLEGVAAAMPADERELLACDGIGPSRLERYGEEILAVLAEVES